MATKPTVNTARNNVYIVDPNPPGMTMHPPEDMFIYVSFKAENRNRSTFVGKDIKTKEDKYINTGTEGEINFIATEVKFNADGEIILNEKNKQKTYATTNYTNIGGISDQEGSGILEGFGIKNIDIKYNASLVPVVDITFTDVRGAALFDTVSQDNRKSPYSIFFKMPYPVFTLSVKGYFGKTVDYCLHLLNWTSNFDGSTGNFDISANFVGFQQAFLADMVLGNIIGAVNTGVGNAKLDNIYNEEQNQPNPPPAITGDIRRLDNFFVQISKLQIEFEDIKENSEGFEHLKAINTQKNKLERIQSFIGTPIMKLSDTTQATQEIFTRDYEYATNDPDDIDTSPILDNSMSIGRDYLSIRDFIVFNAINVGSIKEYFQTLNELIVDYQLLLVNYPELTKDEETTLAFKSIGEANNYENFLVTVVDDVGTEPVPLSSVLDNFSSTQGLLKQSYINPGPNDADPNASFDPTQELGDPKKRKTHQRKMLSTNYVQVLDFREMRGKIQKKIYAVSEEVEIQKEHTQKEINEKLKESLGFNPTIRDVFRIICNNTQAMLSTIHQITTDAESPSNKQDRKDALRGYSTDIPQTSDYNYAWPKVFRTQEGKGEEEIYLGDITGINSYKTSFPELGFVENVHKILNGRRKELKQISKATNAISGLDTDNWYPINPIDYNTNPFIKINNENSKVKILDEFVYKLFIRTTTLNTYSQFPDAISDYALFDGINANQTIFSKNVRRIVKSNLFLEYILNRAIELDLIEENIVTIDGKPYYRIKEKATVGRKFQKIGAKPISGYRNNSETAKKIDYIILDESAIINNSKKLWSDISTSEAYKKITGDESVVDEGNYRNYYFNNNFTSNLFNNVWTKTIRLKLQSAEMVKSGGKKNMDYKLPPLVPAVEDPGSPLFYINKLKPYRESNDNTDYEEYITDSPIYTGQTGTDKRYNQALLLLTSLPFEPFDNAVLKTFIKSKCSRVLNLPTFYLYFIGGLLWRAEQPTDPLWSINKYPKLKTPKNNYITKLGSFGERSSITTGDIPLEDAITQLPKRTKYTLINLFTQWVNRASGFSLFEDDVKTYRSKIGAPLVERSKAGNRINTQLLKKTSMTIPAPMIFYPNSTAPNNLQQGLIIGVDDFTKYFNTFKSKFETLEQKNNKGEVSSAGNVEEEINKSNNTLKLQIYNYFKNINDKWVSDDDKVFNACGSKNKNLIDYFKFIDRGWKDIGDKAVINLNSLLTLSNSLDTSVYFYISKILRDSNFLLQILPNYIDYKDPVEVEEMFIPITNVSDQNRSSGPVYTCIYAGGNSEALDIGEQNRYSFSDDGFSFANGQLPPDFDPDDAGLVAFKVAFGSENQTIFKNVSLSQQEHRETAEYFQVLAETVDKRGGTQRTYQGNDLLRLFKTRSYTCKVEALGCMNIQPLMYFDLQNVPFFHGAYLITGVQHNISPNNMSTSFTGVRQSKYITSFVDSPTVFLDIDLNEEVANTTNIEFSNLATSSPLYSIGIIDDVTADAAFAGLTTGQLIALGVDSNIATEDNVKRFNDIMTGKKIKTNSQAMMFLANVLANSNNMSQREKPWEPPKDIDNYKVYETATINGVDVQQALSYVGFPNMPVFDPPGTNLQNSFRPANEQQGREEDGSLAKELGNTKPGDGYRYRERGYLYLNGKTQYNVYQSTFDDPTTISSNEETAFAAAASVWANLSSAVDKKQKGVGKSCNIYALGGGGLGKGNSTSFQRTIELCQPYGANVEKSFLAFEKVLTVYDVISYDKV